MAHVSNPSLHELELALETPHNIGRAQDLIEALKSPNIELSREEEVQLMFLEGTCKAIQKDPAAEALLARAIKLSPSNTKAWNALAELLWNQGNLEAARDCFTCCLEHKRDKKVLRNLSMLLRKVGTSEQEKLENADESLKLAKEAVALDYDDGESWYVVGNTYLARFFAVSHNPEDLDLALKAYRRSESLEPEKLRENCEGVLSPSKPRNPDLYFNRAQVLGYLERFSDAIQDYKVAEELDPSLDAKTSIDAITRRVAASAELITKKGHVKAKRLAGLVASLGATIEDDVVLQSSVINGLSKASALNELEYGENKGIRLDVCFVMPLVRTMEQPVSLLVVDRQGHMFGVSVYNLNPSVLTRIRSDRDRLTLVAPRRDRVSLGAHAYDLVHLEHPVQLYLNGLSLASSVARVAFSSTSK